MRVILLLLQKEFIQIFRNKTMLPLIFILPVVQLLILVNAATFELKNINMVVVNTDMTSSSRDLISRFEASPFFSIQHRLSMDDAHAALLDNSADVVLVVPSGFEGDMVREKTASLQLLINAIDGMTAGLVNVYAGSIINSYHHDLIAEWQTIAKSSSAGFPLETVHRFWYNPNLSSTIYMLPGILVILVTVIGVFLTAINIVREKEQGTIEQINVTPILKYQFIIGKLIPFLVIALFELAFGLLVGRMLFNLPILGSLWLLFLVSFVYLLVALGLGLLLSAISSNQQQVSFTIYFFLLMFILMSGIFTPTESMPEWAQIINYINPLKYFMQAIRMILLKGAVLKDVMSELISLSIYAVLALSFAVWKYRKTV